MDLNLHGRVAVITGPAKGMGAAITLAFAREGCDLVLAGRDIDQIRAPAQPTDPSSAGLANNGIHAVGNQAEPLYAQGVSWRGP